MKPRIFISRVLSSNSVFREQLAAFAVLIDYSLVEFQALTFDKSVEEEVVFFYSKRGVQYFFEQQPLLERAVQWACLGKGTATALAKCIGQTADFIGSGSPGDIARDLEQFVGRRSLLFVRAEQSVKSVQKCLSTTRYSERVVYRNSPIAKVVDPRADVLVFTSPLNVRTYFRALPFRKEQRIVSIGQTTARALDALGISGYFVAEQPSEQALVKACLTALEL